MTISQVVLCMRPKLVYVRGSVSLVGGTLGLCGAETARSARDAFLVLVQTCVCVSSQVDVCMPMCLCTCVYVCGVLVCVCVRVCAFSPPRRVCIRTAVFFLSWGLLLSSLFVCVCVCVCQDQVLPGKGGVPPIFVGVRAGDM